MPFWPFKTNTSTRLPNASSISSGMLFAIAFIAVGAGVFTWYTLNQLRSQTLDQHSTELTKNIELIASQTELALQDSDLSRIRRLLLDAQATGLYHHLSIRYANDQTLVSTDLGESYLDTLPESWGQPATAFTRKSSFDPSLNQFTLHEPLQVSSTENASLIAESMPIAESSMLWGFELTALLSIFCGGIIALIAFLQLRNRPANLIAIRSALARYAQGQTETEQLLVASDLGPESQAFNEILEERDALAIRLALHECEQTIHTSTSDAFGLSSVCASISQGMIVLDAELNMQYINGSGAAYLSADPATSIGKPFASIDPDKLIMPTVTRILNPDAPRRQVIEIELEHCSTTLRATCTRIIREQDTICMIYLEDVTQQRHADESLNSFIAQATHELRTPLTNIRLYAEEAIDSGTEDEEFRSNAFNMINSESRRLERLVSDMLSVSELEAGSMQIRKDTVRPEAMFDELERDYSQQAESKEIKLIFDLPPKFPTIEADRDRLGQAIHNLIGNALKYTPAEGTVTVKVEFDPSDAMTVRVSDTGIGISIEDQSKIFERFCRATDQRIESIAGTGLGLSITQEIVKMHGGSITVESELDQGSTFILTIPSGKSNNSSKAA
ncbi:MAG: ATP-binding protein [Phycisphaerales bacterium]